MEEVVPDKDQKFQERTEPNCPAMAYALGVFTGTKAEVEPQLDQVKNMPEFWVGGGVYRGHYGVDNAQGGGRFLLNWGIFDPASFELSGKELVQADVSLGVDFFSGFGYSIQEVGCCNLLPCLRNRFFPKSVHLALGVLGVTDPVTVGLEDFDARDGWIL